MLYVHNERNEQWEKTDKATLLHRWLLYGENNGISTFLTNLSFNPWLRYVWTLE
jgi:hypothetical protein